MVLAIPFDPSPDSVVRAVPVNLAAPFSPNTVVLAVPVSLAK